MSQEKRKETQPDPDAPLDQQNEEIPKEIASRPNTPQDSSKEDEDEQDQPADDPEDQPENQPRCRMGHQPHCQPGGHARCCQQGKCECTRQSGEKHSGPCRRRVETNDNVQRCRRDSSSSDCQMRLNYEKLGREGHPCLRNGLGHHGHKRQHFGDFGHHCGHGHQGRRDQQTHGQKHHEEGHKGHSRGHHECVSNQEKQIPDCHGCGKRIESHCQKHREEEGHEGPPRGHCGNHHERFGHKRRHRGWFHHDTPHGCDSNQEKQTPECQDLTSACEKGVESHCQKQSEEEGHEGHRRGHCGNPEGHHERFGRRRTHRGWFHHDTPHEFVSNQEKQTPDCHELTGVCGKGVECHCQKHSEEEGHEVHPRGHCGNPEGHHGRFGHKRTHRGCFFDAPYEYAGHHGKQIHEWTRGHGKRGHGHFGWPAGRHGGHGWFGHGGHRGRHTKCDRGHRGWHGHNGKRGHGCRGEIGDYRSGCHPDGRDSRRMIFCF